jgi:hypothetical protein
MSLRRDGRETFRNTRRSELVHGTPGQVGCARDDKRRGPRFHGPRLLNEMNCRSLHGAPGQVGCVAKTQGELTIGLVPRLRRSDPLRDRFPSPTGWADVWRSALRALHLWPSLPCHFSLNLPQANQLLPRHAGAGGMAKGRVSPLHALQLPIISPINRNIFHRSTPRHRNLTHILEHKHRPS